MLHSFLLTVALAAAAGEPVTPMPQAVLQIPWTDFQAVLKRAEFVEEQIKQSASPPTPPVDWSISEASYAAEAKNDSTVRVQAELALHVWSETNWVRIPVLGVSAAPTSVTLDGNPAGLLQGEADYYELLLRGPGEHRLTIEFYVRASAADGVVSMSFSCAESALTRMHLMLPLHAAQIASPTAATIDVSASEAGDTAELVFSKTKTIDVSWTLPVSAQPAAPKPAPTLSAETWTLATIGDDYVACRARTQFTVLSGDADRFQFTLPADVTVHGVGGDGAEWSPSAAERDVAIDVMVNHSVTGTYCVDISYEVPYTGEHVDVPTLRPADVLRETGAIAIAANTNVELQPGATSRGFVRVDLSDIPPALLTQSALPFLLAFRHGEGDRSLALEVRRLRDVAVPESAIDAASLTSVISDDGYAVTRAVYDVRNRVRQFLRVTLPKGAEVWSARVAGQMVKPALDNGTDSVLLPLNRSAAAGQSAATFPVEVVYKMPAPALVGLRAEVDLRAPVTDLLCSRTQWEVYVPASRNVVWPDGDYSPWFGYAPTGAPPSHIGGGATQREIVSHLRTKSAPAPQTTPTDRARYTGAPLPVDDVGPGMGTAQGVLPVPIALNLSGTRYSFARGVTPANTSTTLRMTTCPAWVVGCASSGMLIAYRATAIGAGYTLILILWSWLWTGSQHKAPLIAFVMFAACLAALRSSAFVGPAPFIVWALLGAVVAAARFRKEIASHSSSTVSRRAQAPRELGA